YPALVNHEILLEGKVEPGFRRDLHTLAFRQHLRRRARASSGAGANRRALAASGYRADDGAYRGRAADDLSRTGASGGARDFRIAGRHRVLPAVDGDVVEVHRELIAAGDFAGL